MLTVCFKTHQQLGFYGVPMMFALWKPLPGFVDALPSVTVGGKTVLCSPYDATKLDTLYSLADQSQVGTKEETCIRLDARSSREYANISVDSNFQESVQGICEVIKKELAPGASKVHAELYKLLIYREGDFFNTHMDAQQHSHMFGSLLLFLPIEYQGGIFQLSKQQTTWEDESMMPVTDRKDSKGCSWVAFYADVTRW